MERFQSTGGRTAKLLGKCAPSEEQGSGNAIALVHQIPRRTTNRRQSEEIYMSNRGGGVHKESERILDLQKLKFSFSDIIKEPTNHPH